MLAPDVTGLLHRWQEGERAALDELAPLVYAELRRLAARYLRQEDPGHTLQSTALVHEAYLRMVRQENAEWQSRAHFFAVAAQMMRRILVDHARAGLTAKRGAGAVPVQLENAPEPAVTSDEHLLAIDEALSRLSELDAQQARIVELRFFSGLSVEETAAVLSISTSTVKREWATAKAWLYRELSVRKISHGA
jgi:RNA polymerase sigma factor (TIGR02999 family)